MQALQLPARITILAIAALLLLASPAAAHPASCGYDARGYPEITECYCQRGRSCDCHGWYVALLWATGPGVYGPFGSEARAQRMLTALRGAMPGVVRGTAYCGNCRSAGRYRGQSHPEKAQSAAIDAVSTATHMLLLPTFHHAAAAGTEALESLVIGTDDEQLARFETELRDYGRALDKALKTVEPLERTLGWWGMLPHLGVPRDQFYAGFPATLDRRTNREIYWALPEEPSATVDDTPLEGPVDPLGADGELVQPGEYADRFEARLTQQLAAAEGSTEDLTCAADTLAQAVTGRHLAGSGNDNSPVD